MRNTLSNSNHLSDFMLRHVPFPTCVLSKDGELIEQNLAFEMFLAQLNDNEVKRLFHSFQKDRTTDTTVDISDWYPIGSGNKQYMHWTVTPACHNGQSYLVISGRDFTEHEKLKQELQNSNNYLSGIMESHLDLVVRVDTQGRFLYVNDAYCETFGKAREELIGHTFMPLVHPEDLERTLLEMEKLYREPYRIYVEQRAKTIHGWRWIAWQDYAIRNSVGCIVEIQAVGRDITNLKNAEEELLASQQRLIEAQETALIGNWEWDLQTEKGFWSDPVFRIFEMEAGSNEVDLNFLLKHIHTQDREEVKSKIMQSFKTNNYSSEHRILTAKGNLRWIYNRGKVEYDSSGKAVRMFGVTQDITHRKLSEISLAKTTAQYRKFLELLPDAVFILRRGQIRFANAAAASLVGETNQEQLLGKSIESFVNPEVYRELMRDFIKLVRANEASRINKRQIIRNEGQIMLIEWICVPFEFEGEPALQIIVRDITLQHKMEEEHAKATKLESLGILAGGIAHDFNNLLTILLGNLSLAKNMIHSEEKVIQKLKEIEKAALQTKDLTKQLLTFSKGGSPIKQTTSIIDVVKEVSAFALSGSNVKIDFRTEDVPLVDIDSGQIGQVINNLIINAAQAMPGGGTIHIDLDTSQLVAGEENYVRIAIRDEGTGIAEEHLHKIFDPYYTTKATGSGLGLTVCYSIINKHNGYLDVGSVLGKGTTFTIYLPISDLQGQAEYTNASKSPVKGRGHILIMDDDEAIGEVIGEMLSFLGYHSTFVKDGYQALAMYERALKNNEKVDAVILDLTIRGSMGGEETIRRLLAIDPEVKAIVSSGYANNAVLAEYSRFGFCGYVAKPFVTEELGQVLSSVINL